MEKARIFANFLRLFRTMCFVMVAFVFGTIGFAYAEDEIIYPFSLTTTELSANDTFQFKISAAGTFYIDCGDGGTLSGTGVSGDTITKSDTSNNTCTCTYTSGGIKTIHFGGSATGYSTNDTTAAISFNVSGNYNDTNVKKISSISGSLGQIFGTVTDPSTGIGQPKFNMTFYSASNMTGAIPSTLFDGIYGTPVRYMFMATFAGCSGLTGSIPPGLFGNIEGAPAEYMFYLTFSGCSGLTGSIPSGLFGNIEGAPAKNMFASTFHNCSGLTGSIPDGLFGDIYGAPASYMFDSTFSGCSGLNKFGDKTYVPGDFLGYIETNGFVSNQAYLMFSDTQLDETCPAGTYNVTRGVFSNAGKPWCSPCPPDTHSPAGATDISQCVEPVVEHEYPFTITASGVNVSFWLSAGGEFYVDCGENGTLTSRNVPVTDSKIVRNANHLFEQYECVYSDSGIHTQRTIKFGGRATEYYPGEAAITFYNAENCHALSVSGDLSAIFPILGDANNQYPRFTSTFNNCSFTSIPETLFSRYTTGAPYMFAGTFINSKLTSIPENLFANITTGAEGMFQGTFQDCTELTSIPENLFANITTGAQNMFAETFFGCSGLTSLPENLFANITTGAQSMFARTFAFSGLTELPENLFANITTGAQYMFGQTFLSCTHLTSIPNNLFANITTGAQYMFDGTFQNCTNLTSIPNNLFANITTGYIGLFGSTFQDCTGLTSLPENLFANIRSTFGDGVFSSTFKGCTGLTGYIPPTLFAGIIPPSTSDKVYAMSSTFNGTGELATTTTGCPENYYQFITGYESKWDDHISCTPCPEEATSPAGATDISQCVEQYPFKLTTTELSAGDTFRFNISAAGTFYVDCGTDGTLSGTGVASDTITKSDTNVYTYTCTYTSDGTKTIRFGGHATGYRNAASGAISFNVGNPNEPNVKKISAISGSLGQIFSTVENPSTGSGQPKFTYTFQGASNMTGTNINDPNNPGMKYALPPTLFDGISGAPVEWMFLHTFYGCSGLTGSIPGELFSGISGAPAESMFNGTFHGCGNLTGSIPSTLFSGISGTPAQYMFSSTFAWCSGLTGSIPSTLFSGISGAPAGGMFYRTFTNCRGLTGSIPAGLFAGISGAPADSMFAETFEGCEITGSIPAGLFGNISGAPANQMFAYTFSSCNGLTGSIPSTLFGNISGAPANQMFAYTFSGCIGLNRFGDKTYVSGNFLADIDTDTSISSQTTGMFYGTQLADPCPAGTYAVTPEQFNDAGKPWCSPCPPDTHSPAGATDISQCVEPYNVIYDCGDGTGNAPSTTSVVPNGAFVPAVNTCTPPPNGLFTGWLVSGTENIVQSGDEIVWDYNTNKTLTAQYITIGNFPFSITTTEVSAGDAFVFTMGANGDFYVDCGDGGTLVFVDDENLSGGGDSGGSVIKGIEKGKIITRTAGRRMRATPTFTRSASRLSGIRKSSTNSPDSSSSTCSSTGTASRTINGRTDNTDFGVYACYYETGGEKTIRFGGTATGYTPVDMLSLFGPPINTGCFPSTIAFVDSSFAIANIDGDLSAMFPYLGAEAGEYPIFLETFAGSDNLTSVPDTLFGGYTTGAPYMFAATFADSGLTSLPGGLFDNITTGAEGMFLGTFEYCRNLRSIPENLFANITTAADGMFMGTFAMCSNLTGFVPPTLFAGLIENSSPMPEMMAQSSLLNGMVGDEDFSMSIFAETSLRTRCPAGYYQYITGYEDYWDGKVSCKPCPGGMTSPIGSTDISQCVEQSDPNENDYKFSIITTDLDDGDSFEFYLSAAGTFYVDCGEGGTLYSGDDEIYDDEDPGDISGGDISGGGDSCLKCAPNSTMMASRRMRATPTFTRSASRLFGFRVPSIKSSSRSTDTDVTSGTEIYREDNTNLTEYACVYSTGGEKTIRFGGRATGYTDADLFSAGEMASTVIFDSRKISDIDGNLSEIFPNFGPNNGEHPMFLMTFANVWGNGEPSSLTSIPDTLFSGYKTGAPYMFAETFANSGLTFIPENLFANITTGAEGMFLGTFVECENLTSIPENLFANITTAGDGMFMGTFAMCPNLTGFVPPTLFAGLIENDSPMPEMMAQSSLLSNQTMSIFIETSIDTQCPENYYQYITGYEDYWDDRVSCKPCPNGGTSPAGSTSVDQCVEPAEFVCESGKYLHIGEDKMCLTKTKPHTRPLLVTKIGNKQYYLRMSPSEVPINNTSNKKFNVLHNGMVYRVFDESMWDEMKGP